MNTIIKYSVAATLALATASCNKTSVTMSTIVNEDGTCHREILVPMAPLHDAEGNIVGFNPAQTNDIHTDSAWTLSGRTNASTETLPYPMSKTTTDSLVAIHPDIKLFACYSRNFTNIDEMCSCTPFHVTHKPLEVKGKLEKHLKWLIFNEYTYTETYPSLLPKLPIPLENFLTIDEAMIWTTGQTLHTDTNGNTTTVNFFDGRSGSEVKEQLDKIENKVNKWIAAYQFYDICTAIENNYNSIPDAPVSKQEFSALKDTLKYNAQILDSPEAFANIFKGHIDPTPYINYMQQYFDNQIHDSTSTTNILYEIDGISADYTLKMPGTIISAGNGRIENGIAIYRLTGERMMTVSDYVITATSRKVNLLAVTLIVIIAIGSTIVARKLSK